MYWAKAITGQFVILKVGDELVVPGLPQHKMRYVGPIGPSGEDVLDPPKGQAARFVHFLWPLIFIVIGLWMILRRFGDSKGGMQ